MAQQMVVMSLYKIASACVLICYGSFMIFKILKASRILKIITGGRF